MTFALSDEALAKLGTVHPALRAVVMRAVAVTKQEFTVGQGVRSDKEAAENLAKGTSATTHSLHLRQPDGYAHAVDLWAVKERKIDWTPDLYWDIADAMRTASRASGVAIRWGGLWDGRLAAISGDIKAAHDAYVAAFRKANGRYPLIDLPHFELPRGVALPEHVA